MTVRTEHMSMNIEGCLRNHKRKKIKIFDDKDGNQISDKDARAYLAECQSKGWKLIPLGECPTFDYQEGCQCYKK